MVQHINFQHNPIFLTLQRPKVDISIIIDDISHFNKPHILKIIATLPLEVTL